MDLSAPSREAFPPPRRPLPGESAAEYELAVLAYLRHMVPRLPQFARCTALMGRELPDAAQFAKVAFWADAVVALMPAEHRPASLDRAFVLHLAFDVFGRAWKACKWARLQKTGSGATDNDSLDLTGVNAHSVSGSAPRRVRSHAAGAPYDRSRRAHTTSNGDIDMQSMTLDAAAVLKGALEAAAVDVDALCATFAAASLDPSPAPRSDAAPNNVKPKRKRDPAKSKRKTRPRPPAGAYDTPWDAFCAAEARFRRFGWGLEGHSDSIDRWKPQPRPRSRPDPFRDCIL